ncbi:restriction endonuclease subunit S [Microbacterium sp. ZW T5_56]|uniref:restriction endonuclease subunit S n=1 Tax=Microbacterium sp. ZW T5_56 TaxID=3378081 RepID=UPI0038552565
MREGWRQITLGDVAETRLGKTLPRGSGQDDDGAPYLRNVNVQWGRIATENLNRMPFTAVERRLLELKRGDILVCEGGEVGRTALVSEDLEGIYFQNALHRVRPSSEVVPMFLALSIERFVRSGGLDGIATRVTIAHLNQTKLRAIQLVLPPLAEQRRIVDLIAAADDAIAAAEGESAATSAAARSLRSSLFSELKQSHPVTTVGELFEMKLGRQKSAAQSIGDHVIPYVRAGNITEYGVAGELLTMNFEPREQEIFRLHEGDVLLAEGGTVGVSARWSGGSEVPVGFDKHVIRIRGRQGVSISDFAHEWARWAYQDGVFDRTATGITIRALGFGRATRIELPDTPLAQQEDVVKTLIPIEEAADAARTEANRLRTLRSNLLTVLLSGEHEIPESYDRFIEEAA